MRVSPQNACIMEEDGVMKVPIMVLPAYPYHMRYQMGNEVTNVSATKPGLTNNSHTYVLYGKHTLDCLGTTMEPYFAFNFGQAD